MLKRFQRHSPARQPAPTWPLRIKMAAAQVAASARRGLSHCSVTEPAHPRAPTSHRQRIGSGGTGTGTGSGGAPLFRQRLS